jgi:Sec-independent protein translocase protein TatA
MSIAAVFALLSPIAIIIIIVVAVILFLPALIPKVGKQLGMTVRMIRDMVSKPDDEDEEEKK